MIPVAIAALFAVCAFVLGLIFGSTGKDEMRSEIKRLRMQEMKKEVEPMLAAIFGGGDCEHKKEEEKKKEAGLLSKKVLDTEEAPNSYLNREVSELHQKLNALTNHLGLGLYRRDGYTVEDYRANQGNAALAAKPAMGGVTTAVKRNR